MYIKIFESRTSSKSYLIQYLPRIHGIENGHTVIENEEHLAIPVDEEEFYCVIDKYFKGKLNEKESNGQERGHEARQENDVKDD